MRPEAASELSGGPNAIAGEIAREAKLDGTLIVLVGRKLGYADLGDRILRRALSRRPTRRSRLVRQRLGEGDVDRRRRELEASLEEARR